MPAEVLTPKDPAEVLTPKDHVVHLYGAEGDLIAAVQDFVTDGLAFGEVAVVIATHEHRRSFEMALADAGIDIAATRDSQQIVWLDATDTVATLMDGNHPSPEAFDAVIGSTIRAAGAYGPVRAYGEMVAVLWEKGLVSAAMELEALWNSLRQEVPFSLLCSYATGLVAGDGPETISELCRLHSDVLGSGMPRRLRGAPPPSETRTQAFPQKVTSPRAARAFVTELLQEWDESQVIDDASLILAELAANAVTHADSPFTVTVERWTDSLQVSVHDQAPTVPLPTMPGALLASGRGMHLVSALATRWGTEMAGSGKTVWAELTLRQ